MNKSFPIAIVVLLIGVAIAATAFLTGDASGDELIISEIVGAVTVTDSDANAVQVKEGIALSADDRIVTGPDGRAVLQLGPETQIRLQEESSLQVKSVTPEEVKLELEGGLLEATVRPSSGAVRVGSRGVEVLATDAEFIAGADEDGVAFEVPRGTVGVAGIPGTSQLGPDQRLTIGSDHGEPKLAPIPEDLLLDVAWPPAEETKPLKVATISGISEPGATVLIISGSNNIAVKAGPDGSFSGEIPLGDGENIVRVEAIDLLGNKQGVRGTVTSDQSVDIGVGSVGFGGGP